MKTFTARFYASWGYGAFDSKFYVVIANTQSEALGFVLEAEPKTSAVGWQVEEIDTSTPGAHYITEQGS